jgi:hypothetical protein
MWREELHPRDPEGQFARKGAGLARRLTEEWASAPWAWRDDESRFSVEAIPARPDFVRDLTPGEIGALRGYTAGGYKRVNPPLHRGEALTGDDAEMAGLLDSAIAKAGRYDEPVTVWRGVALHGTGTPPGDRLVGLSREERERLIFEGVADWAERTFEPGTLYEPSGYQSTSFNIDAPLDAATGRADPGIIFEIQARTGIVLDEPRLHAFGDEDELLQARGTRYEVVGVLRRVAFEDIEGGVRYRTVVKLREVE